MPPDIPTSMPPARSCIKASPRLAQSLPPSVGTDSHVDLQDAHLATRMEVVEHASMHLLSAIQNETNASLSSPVNLIVPGT